MQGDRTMTNMVKNAGYIVMMEWGRSGDEDSAPRFPTKEKALQHVYKRIERPRKKPFIEFHMDKVVPNKGDGIYSPDKFPFKYNTVMNITGIRENGVWNVYVNDHGKGNTAYRIDRNGRRIGIISLKELRLKTDMVLNTYYKQ